MFQTLLCAAERKLDIIEKADNGYPHTQLVIGEMHDHPKVQVDLLEALVSIANALPIGLIGTGECPPYPSDMRGIDAKRAMTDEAYMRELLVKDIRFVRIFGHLFPDVRIENVESTDLRKVAGIIERKCRDLHRLAQENGGIACLSAAQKEDYDYWFSLLKNIVLGDRSMWMVKNLLLEQKRLSVSEAILLCEASHTPFRDEHRPYSVVRTLQALPLNYIVAIVPSAVRPLCQKSAFDFWSRGDTNDA